MYISIPLILGSCFWLFACLAYSRIALLPATSEQIIVAIIIIIIMALWPCVRPWPLFSVSSAYSQSVGFLERGISPSQGLYLCTVQHKHRINAHNTDIKALNGIRTHDPSVRAIKDSSCLRPRGHCDRLNKLWHYNKIISICSNISPRYSYYIYGANSNATPIWRFLLGDLYNRGILLI
jgi:hypothetical protein